MSFSLARRALRRLRAEVRPHSALSLAPEAPARGRVLLSYLLFPPDVQGHTHHTNVWECWRIAQTWRELGFAVDVIDYTDTRFKPQKPYDVCIDIHSNLERLAPLLPPDCLKILHITGAHWIFQNAAEYSRLLALQERRGITLTPRRIAPPSRGIQTCDCATFLGNDFTASTFAFAKKPMTRIPLSTHFRAPWPEGKNWRAARTRFLWMGSTGAVLRGLDVILEAFAQTPDLHLDVCGDVAAEPDFFAAFKRELTETPNISFHGFTSLDSPQFAEIAARCGSLVYPSASEGCSGSVVAAMHGALVPIITRNTGVEVGDWGVSLPDISVESVQMAAAQVASWSPELLQGRARKTWEYVNAHHTREEFAHHYERFARLMSDKLPRTQ